MFLTDNFVCENLTISLQENKQSNEGERHDFFHDNLESYFGAKFTLSHEFVQYSAMSILQVTGLAGFFSEMPLFPRIKKIKNKAEIC
ncbi:MAG: hypothetical protein U5L72_12505 [Bacteroidales bacterium]|nr:hypothetical protein [Bacteroidales bacterium]